MILYHKRTLDIIVSLLGLLLLSPLLLLISLATSYPVGLPVIFKQNRVGLQGKRFLIYKFRTMLDTWHTSYELLNDQQRLTKSGCWLRATSLDELPQLWNVLKG
jgi:lipopolysaccharide/colanic/teichoic acid biosynthesis glycosyltransferase